MFPSFRDWCSCVRRRRAERSSRFMSVARAHKPPQEPETKEEASRSGGFFLICLVPASGYCKCDSVLPCVCRGRIIMAPSIRVTADGFMTAGSRLMRRIVVASPLGVKHGPVRRAARQAISHHCQESATAARRTCGSRRAARGSPRSKCPPRNASSSVCSRTGLSYPPASPRRRP